MGKADSTHGRKLIACSTNLTRNREKNQKWNRVSSRFNFNAKPELQINAVWSVNMKNGNTDQQFVNTREASWILGIPISTLVTWRSRGRCGPPFYTPKGTRRVLYECNELIEWAKGSGRRYSTADRAISRVTGESHTCNDMQGQSEAPATSSSGSHTLDQSPAMKRPSNSPL